MTAIEVFEHLPDPLAFVRETLDTTGSDTIIFTTELHDGSLDSTWWYLTPMLGQHVAFYTRQTLDALGERLGLRSYSAQGLHILTRRDVSRRCSELLLKTSRFSYPLIRGRLGSLLQADLDRAVQVAREPLSSARTASSAPSTSIFR